METTNFGLKRLRWEMVREWCMTHLKAFLLSMLSGSVILFWSFPLVK